MYGSTLLALRGGGWVSHFQKKNVTQGAIQVLRDADGGGGVNFSGKSVTKV